MSRKLSRHELDEIDEDYMDDESDAALASYELEREQRRARRNHVRRSLEDLVEARRLRHMLGELDE